MDSATLLKRELRQVLQSTPQNSRVFDLPRPPAGWVSSSNRVYRVKGVTDEFYGLLNDTLVTGTGSLKILKTVRKDAGSSLRSGQWDETHQVEVPTPSGSLAVLSPTNLKLPYKYEASSPGMGFGQVLEVDGVNQYVYFLPKTSLYKVNLTALVVSKRTMNAYEGRVFKTWNFGTIYLYVIPYTPNKTYESTVILSVGSGVNYTEEVQQYLQILFAAGVLPPLQDFDTLDSGNLIWAEARVAYDGYLPEEAMSLGEEVALTLEASLSTSHPSQEVSRQAFSPPLTE